jgi:hypothetical protein
MREVVAVGSRKSAIQPTHSTNPRTGNSISSPDEAAVPQPGAERGGNMKSLGLAIVACATIAATSASAQQSVREACCQKVGGRWAPERPGSSTYYCFGFSQTGATTNAFYQCVQGGGPKKPK